MNLKLVNTAKALPPYREPVLFWFPGNRGYWMVGCLYPGLDRYGTYFQPYGGGAWYLCDGHTDWAILPPHPKSKQAPKRKA